MNKQARAVSALSIAAIALLLTVSIIAMVLDDGGAPYRFTSARGEAVDLYGGAGPYRYDNTYKAVMFRGFDWVNHTLCTSSGGCLCEGAKPGAMFCPLS